MSADLEAFLTVASTPGIGAVWVSVERAQQWLITNSKTLEFVREQAKKYGLTCWPRQRNVNGHKPYFHENRAYYLKFEREKP